MEGVVKHFLKLSGAGGGMPLLQNASLMARTCEQNIDFLVSLPGSNAGYDMPIEKENFAISTNVTNSSRESIARYVCELNFTCTVSRAAECELQANRSMQPGERKKINDDVNAVVAFVKQNLRAAWSIASQPRAQASSLLVNPPRSARP
eukprot:5321300-Pleurochrysis_carterae.AAC.4